MYKYVRKTKPRYERRRYWGSSAVSLQSEGRKSADPLEEQRSVFLPHNRKQKQDFTITRAIRFVHALKKILKSNSEINSTPNYLRAKPIHDIHAACITYVLY
jgi:hypothetical protein